MMVLLTTFIMPLAVLGSWTCDPHEGAQRTTRCCSCSRPACSACSSRAICFLFYVMWEVMLVPMYFIIGIWGGERRIYASIKFFIYTMVGSLLMLVGILYLWNRVGDPVAGSAADVRLRPTARDRRTRTRRRSGCSARSSSRSR